MLTKVIDWSLRYRGFVLVATLALILTGALAFRALPIDAFRAVPRACAIDYGRMLVSSRTRPVLAVTSASVPAPITNWICTTVVEV